MNSKPILLTGGGTMGPVTPLLAVADALRREDYTVSLAWVGTPKGPERSVVERRGIPFFALSAPKFDRSRFWIWPWIPFAFLLSFYRSAKLLQNLKPSVVVSAGAYVSVPLAIVARLRGIPVWIHQLDVVPGLANRIMAFFATKISITWHESASVFPKKKSIVVGAMVRPAMLHGHADLAKSRFRLRSGFKTLLVVGGGTGATQINNACAILKDELMAVCNVIHVTGYGKMPPELAVPVDGYVAVEFLDEAMADALAAADLVVSRAGMGSIAELAALKKASILVPLPNSQQGANVEAVIAREAAVVVEPFTPQLLLQRIRSLMNDDAERSRLGDSIANIFPLDADAHIAQELCAMRGVTPSNE